MADWSARLVGQAAVEPGWQAGLVPAGRAHASLPAAAASAAHSRLCPPAFQCLAWHSLLQYWVTLQAEHLRSFREGCPQQAQHAGGPSLRARGVG
jgi:hypothetical protein